MQILSRSQHGVGLKGLLHLTSTVPAFHLNPSTPFFSQGERGGKVLWSDSFLASRSCSSEVLFLWEVVSSANVCLPVSTAIKRPCGTIENIHCKIQKLIKILQGAWQSASTHGDGAACSGSSRVGAGDSPVLASFSPPQRDLPGHSPPVL